jgi:hypothetical protein
MSKIINFYRNYENLRNKSLSKYNLIYLLSKVFFEVLITKSLQLLKLDNLLIKLIKKYNLIYSIRSISIKNKVILTNNWSKYNFQKKLIQTNPMVEEYKKRGFLYLGKIFNKNDCREFIKNLNGKYFYNSQQPLQSDGNKYKLDIYKFRHKTNYNYLCFLPESFMCFKKINIFLKKNKNLFYSLLGFKSKIYSALTWINLPTKRKHYVQYLHRDFDDYKFLTIIINWTKVTKNNGATMYIEGSHIKELNKKDENKKYFEGEEGSVYLANNYGCHSGTLPKNGCRISTWIRLGHLENAASIQDGFATTPKI